jgi:hypothetical protein
MDTLGWLLAPVSAEEFIDQYARERVLHVPGRSPDYYAPLFDLACFDEQLLLGGSAAGRVRVVREGQESSRLDRAGVYDAYQAGSTISLTQLHRHNRSLGELCRRLTEAMSSNFQVNAYLTPPDSRGFNKHFDTHDVLVLQILGSKRWRIGSAVVEAPLDHDRRHADLVDRAVLDYDLTVHAGDLLYIPRGFVHEAESAGKTSLHLTVGALPITYADLLLADIEHLVQECPELRESLPFKFARSVEVRREAEDQIGRLVTEITKRLYAPAMLDNAVNILRARTDRDWSNHLHDLEAARTIDARTQVQFRSGLAFEQAEQPSGRIELRFADRNVTLPERFAEAVAAMPHDRPFTVDDLPSTLDRTARRYLLQRLLQEGILTVP